MADGNGGLPGSHGAALRAETSARQEFLVQVPATCWRVDKPLPMSVICQEPPSETARRRILSLPHEPLFLADWERALMIHYAVAPAALQAVVPFEIEQREGEAFVSL